MEWGWLFCTILQCGHYTPPHRGVSERQSDSKVQTEITPEVGVDDREMTAAVGIGGGNDGRIDFINQTGDIKLDLNAEYRAHIFWKLDGALFIDAGNIWTLRNYSDQPGGQFKFDTFWRQIAVAYGLGVRLNFDYFILRLDGGMKAITPAYTNGREHYPIVNPSFSRDLSVHFAVGLPF